jgi:hypothetical protein
MKKHLLCLVLVPLLAGGCAKVSVRKVPTLTQYNTWTDAQQRQADSMEGLRFYMPRPFINVFESFPVRTDIYTAQGELSPDGKYVLIRQISDLQGNSTLKFDDRPFTAVAAKDVQLDAAAAAKIAAALSSGIIPHGAEEKINDLQSKVDEQATTIKKAQDEKATTAAPPPTPGAEAPKTGQGRATMKNDNSALAYQPLRGNFDLLYLPDFEEQYAVKGVSGLGNFKLAMNMGQGWSLQGLDAVTDNSELNKRIFALIDTSMELGKAAASAAMGLPPGATAILPHGAQESIAGKVPAGTPVTLRIVLVHYAAKGMYPVLKPREMQPRVTDGDSSYRYAVDLFDPKGYPKHSGLYSPDVIAKAQSALESPRGSLTVPKYPYQYISFNTFQYVNIEAVTPVGGLGALYDRTGVKGDVGDRQAMDFTEVLRKLANAGPPADAGTDDITKAFINGMNAAIASAAEDSPLKGRVLDETDTIGTQHGSNVDVSIFMDEVEPTDGTEKEKIETAITGAAKASLEEALKKTNSKLGVGNLTVRWKRK